MDYRIEPTFWLIQLLFAMFKYDIEMSCWEPKKKKKKTKTEEHTQETQ